MTESSDRRFLQDSGWIQSQIIDHALSGMMLVDAQQPDMPIVYVNRAFENLTGHSAAEVVGRNARFLQGDDRQQAGREAVRRALTAHEDVITTLRNYRKDGSMFWNEIRISCIRDSQGQVTHFVGMLNDVTARVEAEARYERIFASNSAVCLVINPDSGEIVEANQSAADYYGYPLEQLKARRIYDINAMPVQQVQQGLRHVATSKCKAFSTRHRLASGEVRDVEVHASTVETPAGRMNYAFIADVSDLKQKQWRYQSLFEQSRDAVFLMTLEGNGLQANPATLNLFGYSQEEFRRVQWSDLVTPELFVQSGKTLQRLRSGKIMPILERPLRRKDGSTFAAEVKLELVRDVDNNPLHIQCIARDISERKRMEEALRTSEVQYRLIAENVKDVIMRFSPDLRRLYTSSAAFALCGYTPEELLEMPAFALAHPDDRSTLQNVVWQAIASGAESFRLEQRLRHKDGHFLWVEVLGTIVRNPQTRQLAEIITIVHDISERKQLEDELAAKYIELDQFFNLRNDLLAISTNEGGLLKINQAWEKLTGMPLEQIQREGFVQFLHPDDVEITKQAIEQVAKGKPLVEFVNRYRNPVGDYRYIEWRANPNNDRVYVAGRDITERMQMENSLRQSESNYRELAESVKDVIIKSKIDGSRIYASSGIRGLLGYTPDEVTGPGARELVHPDDREAIRAMLQQAVAMRQDNFLLEQRLQHKDRHFIWVEISMTIIYDPISGIPVELIGIGHDITERKRAEEAILSALQKEKELGELKSRFLSTATHEFRTPLTVILTIADMLSTYRNRYTIEQQDARLGKIQAQVRYMQAIMEDVLQQTKMDAGKVQVDRTNANLSLLLREVIEGFDAVPVNHGRIQYDLGDPDVFALHDDRLSRQVCINLISNALKYSPEGQPVQVSLSLEEHAVILKVTDSGIGIPAADLPHLFEPFHRAANTGSIEGTGLGLSVCRKAMELQDGTISVESEVNRGTTFSVRWSQ